MTSLDEHRSLRTRQEMRTLYGRVGQMIVLSHSKPFLCALWEDAEKNIRSAYRINRAADGSEITEWDVRNDSISDHDKRHELVLRHTQVSNPNDQRRAAESLRPILERFMRVAYPNYFPPEAKLGQFIDTCRRMLGTANEIMSSGDIIELRSLLDYANRFKHDTNPAYETELINDEELKDFGSRTLMFASRR